MDENRMSGTAKNLGGKLEESFGRATGDTRTKVQGQVRQAEGSIQDLYGQAVDSAEDASYGGHWVYTRYLVEHRLATDPDRPAGDG